MKFLQLLARDMDKWPSGADWAVCVISKLGDVKASFGRGDKPKPDQSDRKFHTWTICEPGVDARWLAEHRVISEKASDQLTAIVTRADWEAERAKLKAPKANGGGWIRHRGGKCPVDGEVMVDTRHRDGDIVTGLAGSFYWRHRQINGDIMRYKIHNPAEQPDEHDLTRSPKPAPSLSQRGDTMLAIRDRIRELDTQRAEVESTYQRQISEITQERESLVQRLAGEGLALVEVVVQPVEKILDWTDWRIGDVLTSTADGGGYTSGGNYEFLGMTPWGTARTLDDDGKENGMMPVRFAWHSRPAS